MEHRAQMTSEMQRYLTSATYGSTEVTLVVKAACSLWDVAQMLTGDGTRWVFIVDNNTSAVFTTDVSLAPAAVIKFPVVNML